MRHILALIGISFAFAIAPAAAAPQMEREPAKKLYVPGNSDLFQAGVEAFDAKDYDTAYKIFSRLADQNDLAAMRNVALMRRKGLGTEKDPEGAIRMYRRAAEAGLPTAAADLGQMLLEGEAGEPDPHAALPWLTAAAAADHPVAQYLLAGMYARGYGVERDLGKAEALYARAATRIPAAKDKLDALKKEDAGG